MGGMEWGQGAGRHEGMMHGKWGVCVCVYVAELISRATFSPK